MFSITKTYTDYNGVEKKETFWFNLNKRELSKLALGPLGGLDNLIREITSAGDVGRMIDVVEEIVLMSYGKKTPDGRFAKTDDDGRPYADKFRDSVVYDEIFMDFFTDMDTLIAFLNGVVPSDLKGQVEAETEKVKASIDAGEPLSLA